MADFNDKGTAECVNPLPECPHKEFCGGCIYQGVPYEEQALAKGEEVLKLMHSKGADLSKLKEPFKSEDIFRAPQIYHYRNKMEYTFGDLEKGGEMTLGMHRKKHFMSIVTVDSCQLVHEDFNIILRAVLDFCIAKGYPKYNAKNHIGLMRNLIIRWGQRTGELLVNVVTSSQTEFDEEAFTAALKNVQEKLNNTIIGILHTINDRLADAVYPDEVKVLEGRDYYNEEICGLKFKVSAFSFFQTNIPAVERLYMNALSLLKPAGGSGDETGYSGKNVFDLFCGTGTISQILALKAKKVVGIEIVEDAVESAKANALLNGLENCEFIAGDVFEAIDRTNEKPDVIVVDPPRMGILPKALDKIAAYGTKEILYISCNPKTLAENIVYLQEYYGYRARVLQAYDNFPFSKHTECVCLLSK